MSPLSRCLSSTLLIWRVDRTLPFMRCILFTILCFSSLQITGSLTSWLLAQAILVTTYKQVSFSLIWVPLGKRKIISVPQYIHTPFQFKENSAGSDKIDKPLVIVYNGEVFHILPVLLSVDLPAVLGMKVSSLKKHLDEQCRLVPTI